MTGITRPTPTAPASYTFPKVIATDVDGLGVRVADLPAQPIVTLHLVLPTGTLADPREQAGRAALAARLLGSGPRWMSAHEYAVRQERLGAQIDVAVDHDATTVTVSASADRLAAAADLVADVLIEPRLEADEVRRLRGEQLDGIRARRSDPAALAADHFVARLFPSSAHGLPTMGTLDGTSRLELDDIEQVLGQTLLRDGSTLILAGAVDGIDVAAIARRFCRLLTDGVRPDGPTDDGEVPTPGVVVVDRPGSVQSALCIGSRAPARDARQRAELLTVNAVLGGLFNSRLNHLLREVKGYTYGARSAVEQRRDVGLLRAWSSVESSVTAPAMLDAVSVLAAMSQGAITESEFAFARDYQINALAIELETASAIAEQLREAAIKHLPPTHVDELAGGLRSMSIAAVHDVAAKQLRPEDQMVVVVGDAEQVVPSLEGADLIGVEVVAA